MSKDFGIYLLFCSFIVAGPLWFIHADLAQVHHDMTQIEQSLERAK